MWRCLVPVSIALLFSSCTSDGDFDVICPETCYSGPEYSLGVGSCHSGTPVCDNRGNVTSCDGEKIPTHEICDAIDNDCDGDVDEDLVVMPTSPDNSCRQCGKCAATRELCNPITGDWFCNYENGPVSGKDDTCNGIDDDCDCFVDEDFVTDGNVRLCYSGPEGTVTNGICRAGVETCTDGVTSCEGEVLPRHESCDGVDEDCNGLVDDTSDEYETIDIVFGMDVSGSMGPFIESVTQVVCDYGASTAVSGSIIRFAFVEIANPNGSYSLTSNLTDAQSLCQHLSNVVPTGSSEPTLSAAEAVVDSTNPLLINWSPGSKRIFIGFGDEIAQVDCPLGDTTCESYGTVITNTLAYCSASETDIYWFVAGNPSGYQEQASGCNGDIFWMSPYPESMLDSLNSILETICTNATP